jgi:acetolactate synthase-1/2/3 large subunit
MTGAEAVLRTAAAAGIEVCFANPGTTEMALVHALDRVPAIRPVLGLFEGVCSGAADGYARMGRVPALTLLHLGPGLANALANLHNARRARSPVVNLVGDQATWHRDADAPLTSDIVSLAKPVSRWVRETRETARIAQDTAEAIAAAQDAAGGVATLILPADCQAGEVSGPARPISPSIPDRPAPDRIERIAAALRREKSAGLYLGGRALSGRAQLAAGRVARATGCRLFSETFPARFERGAGLPRVDRLPYFPDWVATFLEGLRLMILAGTTEPVAFFGYPGVPSRLAPEDCEVLTLATAEEDVEAALDALADASGAPASAPAPASVERPDLRDDWNAQAVGTVLATLQPEGAIIVDESATTGLGYFEAAAAAPRHSLLTLTGGSIGMGPPCATYTAQALWTQAREQLHVVTLICANRAYRILEIESVRAGAEAGERALSLMDLSRPALDWTHIARGMGVPASRADSVASLREALSLALAEPGPHLVEVVV